MDKSITHLIAGLKAGDESAAHEVWQRFFHRICGFAKRKVGRVELRIKDEEDLALSALNALFKGAQEGRFMRLQSRDDLWMLLAQITSHKAIDYRRKMARQKTQGESVLEGGFEAAAIYEIVSQEPTDEFLESLSLTCQESLAGLEGDTQTVALLRLQGYSNQEIANKINRSIRSVERYLFVIRSKWSYA